ncbi:hypothetical protein [Caballeronia glathei]|uniref:hypothetical protein n=1 Tax=Caballeronia glathei TaxID=60547 RepID=UPI0012697255|nr:hypothetical protein [Caballeronia glathei]
MISASAFPDHLVQHRVTRKGWALHWPFAPSAFVNHAVGSHEQLFRLALFAKTAVNCMPPMYNRIAGIQIRAQPAGDATCFPSTDSEFERSRGVR